MSPGSPTPLSRAPLSSETVPWNDGETEPWNDGFICHGRRMDLSSKMAADVAVAAMFSIESILLHAEDQFQDLLLSGRQRQVRFNHVGSGCQGN